MAFEVSALSYDLKQDRANVVLSDNSNPSKHIMVQVHFPLATGDNLKEAALEHQMKEKAKQLLQAAAQSL
jgi:hypothetical protein